MQGGADNQRNTGFSVHPRGHAYDMQTREKLPYQQNHIYYAEPKNHGLLLLQMFEVFGLIGCLIDQLLQLWFLWRHLHCHVYCRKLLP